MSGNNPDDKKTVLVTGASGGIGGAVALAFAQGGWNVVCHYFSSAQKMRALEKSLKDKNSDTKLTVLKADFGSEKQVNGFIRKIEALEIHAVINNAGSYVAQKHFSELEIADMKSTFLVNTFVPMLVCGRLFKKMKEKGFGRVVNISSIAAKYGGSAYSLHYGCSKRALEGITRTLAREGAAYNVLVNTVRPGVIDTDFHGKFPKDKDTAKRVEMIPAKRMGGAQEVAELVYYLGSEKNTFITGQSVAVSGGE
jgi:3-oxoacyl-[acyl-carrier protein] reductase